MHKPYFTTELKNMSTRTGHAKKRNFGVKQLILQNVEGGNVQKEKRYYTLGSLSTTIFMEARNLHVTRTFNGKCMGARRIFISIRGVCYLWLDIFGPAGPSMHPDQIFCYRPSSCVLNLKWSGYYE